MYPFFIKPFCILLAFFLSDQHSLVMFPQFGVFLVADHPVKHPIESFCLPLGAELLFHP